MTSQHKQFNLARGNLAHSQSLLDQLHTPTVQQAAEMPQEGQIGGGDPEIPQEPTAQPDSPEAPQEQTSIIDGVVKVIQPMIDEIKSLFTKKEEEPKEVEIKIDGEMTPKQDA